MKTFHNKHYRAVIGIQPNLITISKDPTSEWVDIKLEMNSNSSTIIIRNKQLLEQMVFCLQQLLKDE